MTKLTVSVPAKEVQKSPVIFNIENDGVSGRILVNQGGVEVIDRDCVYGVKITMKEFFSLIKQFGKPNRTARRVRRSRKNDKPALLVG